MTWAILARFAASLSLLTFCWGVSFLGAGSANCRVVARPPGRVCAHTPVAVKRVASLTCFDMAGYVGMGRRGEREGCGVQRGRLTRWADLGIDKSWVDRTEGGAKTVFDFPRRGSGTNVNHAS